MKLQNIKKNCMGTVSFNYRSPGCRKVQDFIVYPIQSGENAQVARIQSDKMVGFIRLDTGEVLLAKGQYGFQNARKADQLGGEELLMLKAVIMSTASGNRVRMRSMWQVLP